MENDITFFRHYGGRYVLNAPFPSFLPNRGRVYTRIGAPGPYTHTPCRHLRGIRDAPDYRAR